MPKDKHLDSQLSQRSDFQSQHLLFLLKGMQSIRTHLRLPRTFVFGHSVCGFRYLPLAQVATAVSFFFLFTIANFDKHYVSQNRTKGKCNFVLILGGFFSHKKDASLCPECTYDKLIILYVVLVSCHYCFSCLTLSHWQNDSLPQQIHFFSSKYI